MVDRVFAHLVASVLIKVDVVTASYYQYIIPTRINMLIGMAAEISKERRAQG